MNLSVSPKLSAANPFLRDPVVRARMVFTSVASSSAIEGIRAPFRRDERVSSKSSSTAHAKRAGKTRRTAT